MANGPQQVAATPIAADVKSRAALRTPNAISKAAIVDVGQQMTLAIFQRADHRPERIIVEIDFAYETSFPVCRCVNPISRAGAAHESIAVPKIELPVHRLR
ncbi:MAG: hypothetical protein JWR80_7251 [Bradyrhizobium sp.]|nr:hypothetical protein [Bradyrhizobium sp.]